MSYKIFTSLKIENNQLSPTSANNEVDSNNELYFV